MRARAVPSMGACDRSSGRRACAPPNDVDSDPRPSASATFVSEMAGLLRWPGVRTIRPVEPSSARRRWVWGIVTSAADFLPEHHATLASGGRRSAGGATCTAKPPRRYSARGQPRRGSSWSVSSRATRRTSRKPFVGPAGGILDRAIDEAGLDRGEITSRTS